MSVNSNDKPLIGVPANSKEKNGFLFQSANAKYTRAVELGADAIPVILPAYDNKQNVRAGLRHLHGVLLTGAPSNVHPSHYGRPDMDVGPYDEPHDKLSLALIECALEEGVPLFAICRGIQELNVALGGSLRHNVHELPGHLDHLGDVEASVDIRYGPRHDVRLVKDGKLAQLFSAKDITVNSIHRQAIDRLGQNLTIEAEASDGLIEAVRVNNTDHFAMGVQWHPEHDIVTNPHSQSLFRAFGAAAKQRLKP